MTPFPIPPISKQWPGEVTKIDNADLHPGYNYNPGLVRKDGKLFMVYRQQEFTGHSNIAVAELDADFKPLWAKTLKTPERFAGYHAEDPRVILFDNKFYVSYGHWSGSWLSYLPSQTLCIYDDLWELEKEIALPYRSNGGRATEKNWAFFEYEKELYFVYWIKPHIVVKVSGGECEQVSEINPEMTWEYGIPRGGAPPVRVGEFYYHWFHSAVDTPPKRRYYMGLYVFEAKPPFKPVAYTPHPLLAAPDGDDPLSWAPLVVFPNGAEFDGTTWTIAIGVHDSYCAILKILHSKVLPKLVKVGRHMEKRVRLRDVNKGVPGGFRVKCGNLVLEANSWNALVEKASRYQIPEEVLHQQLALKVTPEDRAEVWV